MSHLRLRLAIVVGALLALAGSTSGLAASDGVVISQVYGAGGNAGASFTHDFIELFNRGTTPVVLDGMSVQYASATGTGTSAPTPDSSRSSPARSSPASTSSSTSPRAPVGAAPPATDIVDATPIAMAAGAGKVALATGTTTLGCNTAATCTAAGTLGRIVDLVGYGNANLLRGNGGSSDPQRHLVGRQGRQRLHGDRRQRGRLRRALAACSSQFRDDSIRLRRSAHAD